MQVPRYPVAWMALYHAPVRHAPEIHVELMTFTVAERFEDLHFSNLAKSIAWQIAERHAKALLESRKLRLHCTKIFVRDARSEVTPAV